MTDPILALAPAGPKNSPAALRGVVASARFWVYLACVVVAVITAYHLGKEAMWDTLDYHFYAGFSAVHDRFGLDYFPAAWQAYLNPYVYAPFYLLASSGMTALEVAVVLALVQSGVLWLTYEVACSVVPATRPRDRIGVAAVAVALAFANPVLINEIGSSFADITTAEVVLCGWLILLTAFRSPSSVRILCAGLLLGAAGALKLTNSVHALSAAPLVLFVPSTWRGRLRYLVTFGLALAAGFVITAAPWSARLETHFGNPLFPLFNQIFRSPYFTTSPLVDRRFMPASVGSALRLPFAMMYPRAMVHVEWAAPDARYAFVFVVGAVFLATRAWKTLRGAYVWASFADAGPGQRALAALGCCFLTDWVLWLTASGNSRYFIPMACVAAVLGSSLAFNLFSDHPRVRNYILAALLGAQLFQLHAGTEYHDSVPWGDAPWFDVSVPRSIASQPALYFSVGIQSNSFVVPYLAPGSGFINLEGVYTLDAQGPNGRRIAASVAKYTPNLRVLVRDPRSGVDDRQSDLSFLENVDDALEPFGLRTVPSDCSRITLHGIPYAVAIRIASAAQAPRESQAADKYTAYLLTCRIVQSRPDLSGVLSGENAANTAFEHLENACPALFQPKGLATYFEGGKKDGYIYIRRYPNTDLLAWAIRDRIMFEKVIGDGRGQYAGPESLWIRRPPPVLCGRSNGRDYLRVLPPAH